MARQTGVGWCKVIGEEMADLVGIGIIVGFVGQAFISLVLAGWVFLFSKLGYLDVHHDQDSIHHAMDRKRLEIVSEILMVGNDIQMLLGISYMVSIFSSVASMDTYHLHLMYDIVSFVGVSNASALVCWTFCAARLSHRHNAAGASSQNRRVRKRLLAPRYRNTYLFGLLFLALTILLCIRLDEWAPDHRPGRCYDARFIVHSSAAHPAADKVYVAITAAWLLIVMALAIFLGARRRRLVLLLSFLQFPVHLYMALALRTANQGRLEGEDGNENRWDFGQTTAVLLLSIAVSELIRKACEYVKFEKELKQKGLGTRQTGRSPDPPLSQMERDDEKNAHDESGGDGNGDGDVDNECDDSEDGDVGVDENGGGLFEDDIRALEAERRREEKYDGRSV